MKNLVCIIILMFSSLCFATDYYIKNGGNDSASGLDDDNAWETTTKVEAISFNAGDNIYFKRGDTWLQERFTINETGTSANHITIGAYGTGDNPTINANSYYSYALEITGASYVDIVDVNAINAKVGGGGFFIEDSTYITITDCESSDNLGRGFQIYQVGAGTISNITITDCNALSNGKSGFVIYTDGTDNVHHITMSNCIANGNSMDGFSASGTVNNIIWTNCTSINHTEIAAGAGDGFTSHTDSDLSMYYCYAENNAKSAVCFTGTGITTVYYNLLLAKSDATIGGFYSEGTDTLYNNTIYCSTQNGYGIETNGGSLTTRNNIVYGFSVGHETAGGGSTDTDYDCVYGAATAYDAETSEGSNSIQLDPLFTTVGSDFSLQNSSPCINVGTDVGLTQDYLGNSIISDPDMGAYESSVTGAGYRSQYSSGYRTNYRERYRF